MLMKQKMFTIALVSAVAFDVSAQTVSNYQMEYASGTYTELTNPVVLASGASDSFSGVLYDGTNKPSSYTELAGIPIGFSFEYGGQQFTHFLIGSNGFLVLRNDGDAAYQLSYDLSYLYNSAVNLLGCFTKSVTATDDTKISYKLEGEKGNHVLTVEFNKLGAIGGYYGNLVSATYTVQYKLFEATGNVQFVFGPCLSGDNYNDASFSVGLFKDASAGDFILKSDSWQSDAVNNSSNWTQLNMGYYSAAPASGTTYTFSKPKPCVTPTAQPTLLQLSSTSSAVSGSFTKSTDADRYLVLLSRSEALSDIPADGQTYAAGDTIGDARVLSFSADSTFASDASLEGNTTYYLHVLSANTLCSGGPLYLSEAPLTAAVTTAPGAPDSLAVADADTTSMIISAKDNGANDVVVAYTDKFEESAWGGYTSNGAFGTPSGNLKVGDEINGGGKVLYIGKSSDNISLDGLEQNKLYHFRAWSKKDSLYSSDAISTAALTAAKVPWEANFTNMPTSAKPMGWTVGEGHSYAGWVLDKDNSWGSTDTTPFIQNYGFEADSENGTETWIQTPAIYLAENANRLVFNLRMVKPSGYSTDIYTWNDNDSIQIQLTEDGKAYTTVATLTKADLPEFTDQKSFHKVYTTFYEKAGKKVNVRIRLKLYSNATITMKNFTIEQKGQCDYPINVKTVEGTVVGDAAQIDWTSQGDENAWEIACKKSSDSSWKDATKVTTQKKPYTLSGLDGMTKYDVRVRALCDSTTHSSWSDTYTFKSGLAVPFSIDFSSLTEDPEWESKRGELGSPSVLTDGGLWAYSSGYWSTGVSYNSNNDYTEEASDWYISPAFDLGDGTRTAKATFRVAPSSWSTKATDYALYLVVARDGENFYAEDTVAVVRNSDITRDSTYTASLKGYTGKVRLGLLLAYSGGRIQDMTLNEISVNWTSGVSTGIERKYVSTVAPRRGVYTISGKFLGKTVDKANLPKGIYIIDGKKYIIR